MSVLRDLAGLACAVALIYVVTTRQSVPQEQEHAAPAERRSELLCDCLKVYHGRYLRLQVTQQPDTKMCRAACYYEGGTITKGTL